MVVATHQVEVLPDAMNNRLSDGATQRPSAAVGGSRFSTVMGPLDSEQIAERERMVQVMRKYEARGFNTRFVS